MAREQHGGRRHRTRRPLLALTALLAGLTSAGAVAVAQSPDPTSSYTPPTTGYTPPPPGSTAPPPGGAPSAGTAALHTPRACVRGRISISVTGRGMARISVSVNGRVIKAIVVPSGRRTVRSSLPAPRTASRIRVRVTFRPSVATRPRTFTRTVRRCAPTRIAPKFTG